MKNIIIIGAGGHAKVIVDIIEKMNKEDIKILGFLDDNYEKRKNELVLGYKIIGKINELEKFDLEGECEYIIAIGDNLIRKKIFELHKKKYFTAIHPKSCIANNVLIGDGTVVMANVVINAETKIGRHCILNTGSIIEHDNNLGDFVHISPNATLCGKVKVDEGTWVGASSVISQGLEIGRNVIIGAGAVIIKNIKDNCTVVGNPGKIIKIDKEYMK